jgi:transcriptional regulator with PAS, ATPase and Fis domain
MESGLAGFFQPHRHEPGTRYLGYSHFPRISLKMDLRVSTSTHRKMPNSEHHSDASISYGSVIPANRRAASGSPQTRVTGLAAMSVRGLLISCNLEFSRELGYSPQDLSRCEFGSIFREKENSPEDGSRLLKTILSLNGENGEYRSDVFAKTSGGKTLPVTLSASTLRDSSGAVSSIVLFVSVRDESGTANAADPVRLGASTGIGSRKIDDIEFILASPVMHKFMGMVDRVAGHTETVLITGETGTGKELIARTIHESSHRRNRPWVDINCAALPENLVESELFGYEKGAFSGADASKPGLFELADKGTLFLDEIGELELHTQVKLLRVLDGQPFYRLGGHRKIRVDVRVVAATNQDLEAAVRDGRFRQDLFHRLSQFQLKVPPLHERPEDVVALAEHFLRLKSPAKHFSAQAISALLSHSWPGNIRELRNFVAKVAMESAKNEIDFPRLSAAFTGEPSAMRQTASIPVANLDSMEEQMIIKALERTGGHRALAAEQLGISRRTLSRKLKEYNISFAQGGQNGSSPIFVSTEQQKFFRARIDLPVTVKNSRGDEIQVRGVNLSTGGMGLDGLKEPLRFSGMLDVQFGLPESDVLFQAKARLMWVGDDGRVGIRFAVIEPALFEQLQRWSNRKMKEEGWEFPE